MSQSAQTIFEMADRTDSDTTDEPDVVTHGDFELELDTTMSDQIESPGKTIPRSVEQDTRFIGWRYEDGGESKAPLAPEFRNGSARRTDGTSLTGVEKSYAYALGWVNNSQKKLDSDVSADGVGLILTDDDDLVCYDLDDCVDPETGAVEQWAWDVVQELDSFTEISASGTGLHVWARGENPDELANKNSELGFECYSDNRYIGITCDHVAGTPYAIKDRTGIGVDIQRALLDVTDESDDEDITLDPTPLDEIDGIWPDSDVVQEIIELASGKDAEFERLYNGRIGSYGGDASRADYAFACKLSFWTNGNIQLMDRIGRMSGLEREKWDERRNNTTYWRMTMEKALRENPDRYTAGDW